MTLSIDLPVFSLLTGNWVTFTITASSAVVSLTVIACGYPLFRRYALARPNARSSHREPTPQGGGIAVVTATVLVSLVAAAIVGLPEQAFAQLHVACGAA